jgi:hypothetical protein
MAKIDKLLEQLEQSDMFFRFVKKVARGWYEEKPKSEPTIKTVEIIVEKPVDRIVEVEKVIEKKVMQEVVPAWANPLAEYQPLVQYVTKHPSLASILLTNAQPQEQLLRFLVCGSQWSNILRVWDALAEQAKQTQQPINATEQQVLDACLALFNQTLSDCQAQLQYVEQGASYHYDHHQRANSRGERVQTVLLQGLLNAAEDVVRSAVVITQ